MKEEFENKNDDLLDKISILIEENSNLKNGKDLPKY